MGFHFQVEREDLLRAIGSQQNITSKKGTLAILSNILLDVQPGQVIITATDLEIGLKQTVSAEVFETGKLTLPSKKLFELARESGSSLITFKQMENNWVEITAGSSLYRLAGMVSDEFPEFPEFDEKALVEIESSLFADLIDKTFFSIALDKEQMFTLTAAFLQKHTEENGSFLEMITSDGHRLTLMKIEVSKSLEKLRLNKKTLIPRRGIQEIRKFCETTNTFLFCIEEKQAVFKSKQSLLIIRIMEGDFPDFQGILHSLSKDNVLKIDRIRFLESLKRINLFTDDLFNAIKIDIKNNKMILLSQNADYGSAKDEIDIEYTGKEFVVGFNCKYFIDSLQAMEGDVIEANISSEESPCMIYSYEDKGFLSVIMPMKL